MGNAYSDEARHSNTDTPVGYRVMSVNPGGPATRTKVLSYGPKLYPGDQDVELARAEREPNSSDHSLVSFFDFILSVNGHRLVSEIG